MNNTGNKHVFNPVRFLSFLATTKSSKATKWNTLSHVERKYISPKYPQTLAVTRLTENDVGSRCARQDQQEERGPGDRG